LKGLASEYGRQQALGHLPARKVPNDAAHASLGPPAPAVAPGLVDGPWQPAATTHVAASAVAEQARNAVRREYPCHDEWMPHPVTVRPMDARDLPVVAQLHERAFAERPSAQVGNSYTSKLFDYFLTSPDAVALVAGAETPEGYVVGAPPEEHWRLQRQLLPVALAGLARRPWILLRAPIRRAIWGRVTNARALLGAARRPDGTKPARSDLRVLSLVAIGVDPGASGRGLGKALIAAFEDEARARGVQRVELSVRKGNDRARALYERCGWAPSGEEGDELIFTKALIVA
jgi:ribosomal protein S18 acetylase RimI-like enzyme